MNSEVNTKKFFFTKYAQNFTTSGMKTIKKGGFIVKSAKKLFLPTNTGLMISILGVLGLEMHFSGTEPATFFGAQSSLGGMFLVREGTSSDLGRHGLEMPSYGAGPAAVLDCYILGVGYHDKHVV